jgi:hypothetical protein
MRIDEVRAHHFGGIGGGRVLALGPELNVVVGPNEVGKSSWHAAIFGALCGTWKGNTKEGKAFKARHAPWIGSGWEVGAALTLDDGRRIEVWQNLSKRTFWVKDVDTGTRLTAEFTYNDELDLARWAGLDRKAFLATACVRQTDLFRVGEETNALQSHMQRAAASADSGATAAGAIQAVDQFVKAQIGSRRRNSSKPLQAAIVAVDNRRQQLDQARAQHQSRQEATAALQRADHESTAADRSLTVVDRAIALHHLRAEAREAAEGEQQAARREDELRAIDTTITDLSAEHHILVLASANAKSDLTLGQAQQQARILAGKRSILGQLDDEIRQIEHRIRAVEALREVAAGRLRRHVRVGADSAVKDKQREMDSLTVERDRFRARAEALTCQRDASQARQRLAAATAATERLRAEEEQLTEQETLVVTIERRLRGVELAASVGRLRSLTARIAQIEELQRRHPHEPVSPAGVAELEMAVQAAIGRWRELPPLPRLTGRSASELQADLASLPSVPVGDTQPHATVEEASRAHDRAVAGLAAHDASEPHRPDGAADLDADEVRRLADLIDRAAANDAASGTRGLDKPAMITGVALAIAGLGLAFMAPIAGVLLVAAGIALTVYGLVQWSRRRAEAMADHQCRADTDALAVEYVGVCDPKAMRKRADDLTAAATMRAEHQRWSERRNAQVGHERQELSALDAALTARSVERTGDAVKDIVTYRSACAERRDQAGRAQRADTLRLEIDARTELESQASAVTQRRRQLHADLEDLARRTGGQVDQANDGVDAEAIIDSLLAWIADAQRTRQQADIAGREWSDLQAMLTDRPLDDLHAEHARLEAEIGDHDKAGAADVAAETIDSADALRAELVIAHQAAGAKRSEVEQLTIQVPIADELRVEADRLEHVAVTALSRAAGDDGSWSDQWVAIDDEHDVQEGIASAREAARISEDGLVARGTELAAMLDATEDRSSIDLALEAAERRYDDVVASQPDVDLGWSADTELGEGEIQDLCAGFSQALARQREQRSAIQHEVALSQDELPDLDALHRTKRACQQSLDEAASKRSDLAALDGGDDDAYRAQIEQADQQLGEARRRQAELHGQEQSAPHVHHAHAGEAAVEMAVQALRDAIDHADTPGVGIDLDRLPQVDDLEARRTALLTDRDHCRSEASRLRGQLDQLAHTSASVPEAIDHLAEGQAELDRLERLAGVLEHTRSFLSHAQDEVHRTIAPQLAASISQSLPMVVGDRYEAVQVDPTSLAVTVRISPGNRKNADLLSHGTREQLYLLLRVALVDHLTRGQESMPMLLDEVTAHADDQRAGRLLDLLLEMSADRQIVLFTQETRCRDWAARHTEESRCHVIEL